MAQLLKFIPSTGSVYTRWRLNNTKPLPNGGNATFYFSQEEDERLDAVVIEKDNEVIAAGWIGNLLEWGSGGETESYFVQEGKNAAVSDLLGPYQSGSEKIRDVFEKTRNYGLVMIFSIEFIATLLCGLLVFAVLCLGFAQSHLEIVFTLVVALAIIPSVLAVFKRNQITKEKRRELLLNVIDDILLYRIYLLASGQK